MTRESWTALGGATARGDDGLGEGLRVFTAKHGDDNTHCVETTGTRTDPVGRTHVSQLRVNMRRLNERLSEFEKSWDGHFGLAIATDGIVIVEDEGVGRDEVTEVDPNNTKKAIKGGAKCIVSNGEAGKVRLMVPSARKSRAPRHGGVHNLPLLLRRLRRHHGHLPWYGGGSVIQRHALSVNGYAVAAHLDVGRQMAPQ